MNIIKKERKKKKKDPRLVSKNGKASPVSESDGSIGPSAPKTLRKRNWSQEDGI
jgi:hypothetical protein